MKQLLFCIALLCCLCGNAQTQIIHSVYDVNGDHKVDVNDVTQLINRVIGKITTDQIVQTTAKVDTIHYKVVVNDTTNVLADKLKELEMRIDSLEKKHNIAFPYIDVNTTDVFDFTLLSSEYDNIDGVYFFKFNFSFKVNIKYIDEFGLVLGYRNNDLTLNPKSSSFSFGIPDSMFIEDTYASSCKYIRPYVRIGSNIKYGDIISINM